MAASSAPRMPASSWSPKPDRFSVNSRSVGHVAQPDQLRRPLQLDDLGELLQEPRVDLRQVVDRLDRPAAVERLEHAPHPAVGRHHQLLAQRRLVKLLVVVRRGKQPALAAQFERPDALEKRLLEGAADGHRLAHRLHLGGQRRVGFGELLEVPPRDLDDDVVDGRLEGGRREPRDVVGNLVQVIAQGQLGGDLGDRKPGGLRRQRRGPRHARVHLDADHPAVGRVHRKLDVRAAGFDADPADDAPRRVAHPLVFLVRQASGPARP